MSQFDAFGDIINQQNGIFGDTEPNIAGTGGGLKAHDTPNTQATNVGVAVEMQCRGCPRPLRLTVEYPELVAIKYGVAPQVVWDFARRSNLAQMVQQITEWRYSPQQQAFWPVQHCSGCQNIVGPMFTPEEAEHHLAKARRNGWINADGERSLSQLAYQAGQEQAAAAAQMR